MSNTRIDKKAIPWVNMINSRAGLETVGSCGGHKNPKGCDQVPENEFYVQFRFDTPSSKSPNSIWASPSEDGWASLCDILSYITECEYNEGESLKIEMDMTIFSAPFFVMRGKNIKYEDLYE
jgi:hypothetical protein